MRVRVVFRAARQPVSRHSYAPLNVCSRVEPRRSGPVEVLVFRKAEVTSDLLSFNGLCCALRASFLTPADLYG